MTVLREIVAARPEARYVYVADDAFFPYGHHSEQEIIARAMSLGEGNDHRSRVNGIFMGAARREFIGVTKGNSSELIDFDNRGSLHDNLFPQLVVLAEAVSAEHGCGNLIS